MEEEDDDDVSDVHGVSAGEFLPTRT